MKRKKVLLRSVSVSQLIAWHIIGLIACLVASFITSFFEKPFLHILLPLFICEHVFWIGVLLSKSKPEEKSLISPRLKEEILLLLSNQKREEKSPQENEIYIKVKEINVYIAEEKLGH